MEGGWGECVGNPSVISVWSNGLGGPSGSDTVELLQV